MLDVQALRHGRRAPSSRERAAARRERGAAAGLLHAMTGALGRSLVVAALFALHPLHVESVAWIAERKDVLSTACWMIAVWAYVAWTRRGGGWRYGLVVLAFALGLMSKPMVVTLPFVLVLLDYWPLRRVSSPRRLMVVPGREGAALRPRGRRRRRDAARAARAGDVLARERAVAAAARPRHHGLRGLSRAQCLAGRPRGLLSVAGARSRRGGSRARRRSWRRSRGGSFARRGRTSSSAGSGFSACCSRSAGSRRRACRPRPIASPTCR